jgi:hypothetical protein
MLIEKRRQMLEEAKVPPLLFKKVKKLKFLARNIANFFADCANRFNFVV